MTKWAEAECHALRSDDLYPRDERDGVFPEHHVPWAQVDQTPDVRRVEAVRELVVERLYRGHTNVKLFSLPY